MNNGMFKCTFENDPYDFGELIVQATETEKSMKILIKKAEMLDDTYVSLLFKKKGSVTITKKGSRHALIIGKGWFVIYPDRRGIPLSFVSLEEES